MAKGRGAKGGGDAKRTVPGKGAGVGLTRRQRRRIGWAAGALAVVVAAIAAGWLWARTRGPAPGEFVPNLGNAHIATADTPHQPYNSEPPTSGPHLPYIAPWGVHTRPIPKELQLHNLEDAGVVVSYRPDCADRVLAPLQSVVTKYPDHVILAPYPGLDRCIAITAWTRIDKFDEPDERRVTRFIDAYRGIDHHVPGGE